MSILPRGNEDMTNESCRNLFHALCDMMSDKVNSTKLDSAKFSEVTAFLNGCKNICVNPASLTSSEEKLAVCFSTSTGISSNNSQNSNLTCVSENSILTVKSEDSSLNDSFLQHIFDPNISQTLQDEVLSNVFSLLLETKDTSCSKSVISENSIIALDGSYFSDEPSSQKFSETSSQNLRENNSDPDFTNIILSDDYTEVWVNNSSTVTSNVDSGNCKIPKYVPEEGYCVVENLNEAQKDEMDQDNDDRPSLKYLGFVSNVGSESLERENSNPKDVSCCNLNLETINMAEDGSKGDGDQMEEHERIEEHEELTRAAPEEELMKIKRTFIEEDGQQSNNTGVIENTWDVSNLQTEIFQGVTTTKEKNTIESQGFDYEIPVDKLNISENVNNLSKKMDECESPKEQDTVESQGFEYEIPVDKLDISENVNNLSKKMDECESPKEQDTVESQDFEYEISLDGQDVAVYSNNHDEHEHNKATTADKIKDGDQGYLSIVGKVPSVELALQQPVSDPVHTVSPVSCNSKVESNMKQMLFHFRTSVSTTLTTHRTSKAEINQHVEKCIKIMAMHFDIQNGTYRCLECKMDWKERPPFWLHFWGHMHIDHELCKNCSGFENSMPDCSDTEMLLYHFEKSKETVQNPSSIPTDAKKDDLVNLSLGESSSSKDNVICIDFDDEIPSAGKGDCVVHVESSDTTTTKSSEISHLSVAYEKVQKFIASNKVLETPPNVDPVEFAKKKLNLKNEILSLLKKFRDEVTNKVQPTLDELAEASIQTKLEIIRELFERITPSASKNNMICQSSALIPTSDVEENQDPIVLQNEKACSEDLHTSSNVLQHEVCRSKDSNTDTDTLNDKNPIQCKIRKPANKNNLEWKSPQFFSCSNCRFSTLFLTEFKKHLWNKHFNESQMCLICGYTTKEIDLFTKHFQRHANTIKPTTPTFECLETKCVFKCNILRDFLFHLSCHPKYEMKCHFCKSIFLSLEDLQSHLECSLLTIVTCLHCRAKAMDKKSVIEHISECHPDKGRMITITKQLICKERQANNFNIEKIAAIQQECMDNADESDVQFIPSNVPETDSTGIKKNEVKTKSSGSTTNHNKRPASALTVDQEFNGASEKVTRNELPQMQPGTELSSEDLIFHETVADKISELDVTISSEHISDVNTSYDVSDCVEINLNQESFEDAGNEKRPLMTSVDTQYVDNRGDHLTDGHLSPSSSIQDVMETNVIKCMTCPYTCITETQMKQHQKNHTPNQNHMIEISSDQCFESPKMLLFHKVFPASSKTVDTSDLIDEHFSNLYNFQNHLFACKICTKRFKYKRSLYIHLCKHLSIQFRCEICNFEDIIYTFVTSHMKSFHDVQFVGIEFSEGLQDKINNLLSVDTDISKKCRRITVQGAKGVKTIIVSKTKDSLNAQHLSESTENMPEIKEQHKDHEDDLHVHEAKVDNALEMHEGSCSPDLAPINIPHVHEAKVDNAVEMHEGSCSPDLAPINIPHVHEAKFDNAVKMHEGSCSPDLAPINISHVHEAKFDNAVEMHEGSCSPDLASINIPHDSKKKRSASCDSNNESNVIKCLKLDKDHISCQNSNPSHGPHEGFSLRNSFGVAHTPANKAGKSVSSTSPSKLMQPSTSSSCVVDINNIKQSPKCKLLEPMNLSPSKAKSKAKIKFNFSKSKSSSSFARKVSTNSSKTTTMTNSFTKGASSNAASRINHKDTTSVYQCLKCSFETVFDKKRMENHKKTHKLDRIYECIKCKVKFHSFDQIQRHIKFFHQNDYDDNLFDDNNVRILLLKDMPLLALFKLIDVEHLEREIETASPTPSETEEKQPKMSTAIEVKSLKIIGAAQSMASDVTNEDKTPQKLMRCSYCQEGFSGMLKISMHFSLKHTKRKELLWTDVESGCMFNKTGCHMKQSSRCCHEHPFFCYMCDFRGKNRHIVKVHQRENHGDTSIHQIIKLSHGSVLKPDEST